MVIPVPVPTHSTLMRNHHNVGLLQASLDLWDQADQMVFRTHSEDFFIQLDHEFGSLTLHSPLRELVRIVRAAVERLGNYNRDCAIGRDVNWP
ncbi:AF4/FMR2 family member lilli-like [Artemia franciscana]|uniref:AF4/FMR2 family member lilli-like n=1 Tax=Artemia franciscana TaxID=6661 RepID=UPI0032D9C9B7